VIGSFSVKIVDSSLWVHQLRRNGDPDRRARVETLLINGDAAWCAPVRLELWRGVRNLQERKTLRAYEATLPDFEVTRDAWRLATLTADRGRAAGLSFPFPDLLIFGCALFHGLEVEAADVHYEQMRSLHS